jgi:hypothetical protein
MKLTLPLLALLLAGSVHAQSMPRQFQVVPREYHPPVLTYEEHQRKLMLCMVDLRTITDQDLRKWCERQSLRLP